LALAKSGNREFDGDVKHAGIAGLAFRFIRLWFNMSIKRYSPLKAFDSPGGNRGMAQTIPE
jgi:hypothetical protein